MMARPCRYGILVALGWIGIVRPVQAQLSAFLYRSVRVPVARAFFYRRSDLDGTNPTSVTLYVAGPDRIEVLRWRSADTAMLAVGVLDWQRYSLKRLETRRLLRGRPDSLLATFTNDGSGLISTADSGRRYPIAQWPWYNLDLDLADLNLTLPHLVKPAGSWMFELLSGAASTPSSRVADLGAVTATFERRERHLNQPAVRYQLAGPGLSRRGGVLWADSAAGHILDYAVELPEGGETQGVRLQLERVAPMTRAEWETYRRSWADRR
jgi:hypothetical protein